MNAEGGMLGTHLDFAGRLGGVIQQEAAVARGLGAAIRQVQAMIGELLQQALLRDACHV